MKTDQAYALLTTNFFYSLDGYRQLLKTIDPVFADMGGESSAEVNAMLESVSWHLTKQERHIVADALRRVGDQYDAESGDVADDAPQEEAAPEIGIVSTPEVRNEQETPPSTVGAAMAGDEGAPDGSVFSALDQRTGPVFFKILRNAGRLAFRNPQAQRHRLYRAVLVGLVSQFEVLVGDVVRRYYEKTPKSLFESERKLKVSDVLRYESIEEFRQELISQEVERLMMGSVDDWASFLDKNLQVPVKTYPQWAELKENVLRRHLVIHTAGRVSRRYLSAVDQRLLGSTSAPEGLSVGDRLTISREYIVGAVDRFEVAGMMLAYSCWQNAAQLDSSADGPEEHFLDYLYDLLIEQKWGIAASLAKVACSSGRLSKGGTAVARTNYWLAMKRSERWKEVSSQVAAFDDSDLDPSFQMARLAILGEYETLFSMLEKHGSTLEERAWYEWPVFSEVREHKRFVALRDVHAANRRPPAKWAFCDQDDVE